MFTYHNHDLNQLNEFLEYLQDNCANYRIVQKFIYCWKRKATYKDSRIGYYSSAALEKGFHSIAGCSDCTYSNDGKRKFRKWRRIRNSRRFWSACAHQPRSTVISIIFENVSDEILMRLRWS